MTTITLFLTTSIFSQSGPCVYKGFHPGQHCWLSQTCFSHSCSADFIPDINNRRSVSASLPTCMGAASGMLFSGVCSSVCLFWVIVTLQVLSRICVLHIDFVYGHLTLKIPKQSYCLARLCPRLLHFHLWFLHSPLFWFQAGALVWPHPGQSRTHLNHFRVLLVACSVVLLTWFRGIFGLPNVVFGASSFWPLQSLLLVSGNHNVIYTCHVVLSHVVCQSSFTFLFKYLWHCVIILQRSPVLPSIPCYL